MFSEGVGLATVFWMAKRVMAAVVRMESKAIAIDRCEKTSDCNENGVC